MECDKTSLYNLLRKKGQHSMEYDTTFGEAARDAAADNCDFFDGDDERFNLSAHSSSCSRSSSSTVSSHAQRREETEESHSDDEGDCADEMLDFDESDRERLVRLVGESRMLHQRFLQYCASHDHVQGLGKLRTRFEREAEMGERELLYISSANSPKPEATPTLCQAVTSRQSFVKCNCIALLELTLHTLENEPDVVAVMSPVNDSKSSQTQPHSRRKTDPTGDRSNPLTSSIEVDVVSCGGLRWVKLKGTSKKNMDLEIHSTADKRPFPVVLDNMSRWASRQQLPFGLRPHLDVVFYSRPSDTFIAECRSAVSPSSASVSFHCFEDQVLRYLRGAQHNAANASPPPDTNSKFSWCDIPLARRFELSQTLWRISPSFLPPLTHRIDLINFDVTAVVALCTDTCNGYAGCQIPKHPILDEQSMKEQTEEAIVGFIEPCLVQHTRVLPGGADDVRTILSQWLPSAAAERLDVTNVCGFALNSEQREKLLFDATGGMDGDMLATCSAHPSGVLLDQGLIVSSGTLRKHAAAREKLNWVITDVALAEILWILATIAGPAEYRRAVMLLRRMHVVHVASVLKASPDLFTSSVLQLDSTGKISDRHKFVFGLGDLVHAVTISANKQFVQAAKDQGVDVCVAPHPSRAFTERKRTGTDRMDGPRKPPATLHDAQTGRHQGTSQ